MRLSEEELKEHYRQRTGRSAGEQECLTEEALLRAASRVLTRQERARVVRHLRACSDCAREYRIVHSTREWVAQVSPAPGGSPAATAVGRLGKWPASLEALWNQILSTHRGRAAALVAMIVVAAGVALIVWRGTQEGSKLVLRERGATGLVMKVDPSDGTTLREAPIQLSWSEVESAESYQVALYDFELTPIWESSPGTGTSVRIPESVRASLARGRFIYWRVIVTIGIERRQSGVFRFILTVDEQR